MIRLSHSRALRQISAILTILAASLGAAACTGAIDSGGGDDPAVAGGEEWSNGSGPSSGAGASNGNGASSGAGAPSGNGGSSGTGDPGGTGSSSGAGDPGGSSSSAGGGPTPIPEATYEVGPGKPFASLDDVAPLLQPGDVVTVQGDHTYSGGVILENSGTAADKIRIFGIRVNGKRPRFEGGNNTIEIRASHNELEGLDVTGGSTRCIYHHGDQNVIRDTVVHDCDKQGILGGDYDTGSLTLEYVEVYGCGGGQYDHQIYMANDQGAYPDTVFRMQHCYLHDGNGGNNVKSRASRNEIYYNWIEGSYYHELELICADGQDPDSVREDSDVVGNVIKKVNSNHFAVRVGGDKPEGESNGRFRFVNNTFLLKQGSSPVFRLYEGVESIQMHNNVFYKMGGGGVVMMDDSEVSWTTGDEIIAGSNNWVASGSNEVPSQWTGTLTGDDPGFTSLESNNLKPTGSSALLEAGNGAPSDPPGYTFPSPLALPLALPPPGDIEDMGTALGRPVVGAIDIGAIEHN